MSFIKDYFQLNPETAPAPARTVPEPTPVTEQSFDDMKAYFEAMKESMLQEVRAEIQKNMSAPTQTVDKSVESVDKNNNSLIEGGDNNASNTDL